MGGLVEDGRCTFGIAHLVSQEGNVSGEAVGVGSDHRVPILPPNQTSRIRDHIHRIEFHIRWLRQFVEDTEPAADRRFDRTGLTTHPPPRLAIGARDGCCSGQLGRVVRVERNSDHLEIGTTEIGLDGDALTDLSHRVEDGITIGAATGRSKRVEGHRPSGVLGGEALPDLVDEGEAGRQSHSGKNLNRLKNGKRHHSENRGDAESDHGLADTAETVLRLAAMSRILVGVMLILGACAVPTLDQGPGIEGTYVVNGVDPVGTEYTGRIEIVATDDPDTYAINWVITGALLTGEGVLDGTSLTVTWETVNDPRGVSTGTGEYEVLDDGRIVGTRSVDGFDGVGTEEIFPEP